MKVNRINTKVRKFMVTLIHGGGYSSLMVG